MMSIPRTCMRVDDYPTSMNLHGIEAMKTVQSALYQVFGGTNCSTDRFYRYKKGGYTELMLKQMMNSQENNQTDRNTEQHEEM
ncbi:uncharacterized protein [Miscanthus floridulus]|uniref:uncharacterized protein isoform X3 n=1 Tax=Miscanthus floridulus TaxID=154761 RepID=UPI00345747DB